MTDDIRPCICADPQDCTQPVPGYRCRKGEAPRGDKPRCSCYVLPHADDCALVVGLTRAGERVLASDKPETVAELRHRVIQAAHRPRPMCRDCADRDGTCYDGTKCDPFEAALDTLRAHVVSAEQCSAPVAWVDERAPVVLASGEMPFVHAYAKPPYEKSIPLYTRSAITCSESRDDCTGEPCKYPNDTGTRCHEGKR